MSELSSNIILVILVTSLATYLSRFLGVVSSEKIDETSKIFRWFNCIPYSILAALIARIIIFPAGVNTNTSSENKSDFVLSKKSIELSVFC